MDNADPELHQPARQQRPFPERQAPSRRPPLGLPASMASDMPGFVERGVHTAYTVIDAYMKRGLQAAQRQAAFVYTAPVTATAEVLGSLSPWLNTSWAQAATTIAGPWAQLVRAWADSLAALAPLMSRAGVPEAVAAAAAGLGAVVPPGAAPAPPSGEASSRPSAPPPAAAVTTSPRPKVTIEFMSRQRAEVSLSLEPGADLAQLHARWEVGEGPPPSPGQLTLYSEPGHVHLRVTLAEPSVPGCHRATIADRHGQCFGTVVLNVAEPV